MKKNNNKNITLKKDGLLLFIQISSKFYPHKITHFTELITF
jgi:hypothetical protein